MARPTRVEVPGALYHILARGNQRRAVFRSRADYETYLARLSHYQERYGFTLYAYVLMPNHIHLLLEPGNMGLAKIMQGLHEAYAFHFNWAHRMVGHVFQGRYKALLCDKDRYLLALVRYLHLNPVRSRLAQSPADWPWSSHAQYLGRRVSPPVAAGSVLQRFHATRGVAVRRYLEFLEEPGSGQHQPEYYQAVEQRFLGDERFVEQVRRREAPSILLAVTLPEVSQAVARAFDLEIAELQAPGRGRQAALVRAAIAHLGQLVGGIPLSEVARAFGRDPVTISLGVQRLRTRLEADAALAARVEQVAAALRKGRSHKYKISNV